MSSRFGLSCFVGLIVVGWASGWLALRSGWAGNGIGTGTPAEPRCFLYGSLREVGTADPRGFGVLKHMIRLRLDADDPTQCGEAIKRYCRALDPSKFVPKRLRAYFRAAQASQPSHYYEVQATCDLTVSTGAKP